MSPTYYIYKATVDEYSFLSPNNIAFSFISVFSHFLSLTKTQGAQIILSLKHNNHEIHESNNYTEINYLVSLC